MPDIVWLSSADLHSHHGLSCRDIEDAQPPGTEPFGKHIAESRGSSRKVLSSSHVVTGQNGETESSSTSTTQTHDFVGAETKLTPAESSCARGHIHSQQPALLQEVLEYCTSQTEPGDGFFEV